MLVEDSVWTLQVDTQKEKRKKCSTIEKRQKQNNHGVQAWVAFTALLV